MKKRVFSLLAVIVLLLCLALPAAAEERNDFVFVLSAELDLTDSEIAALSDAAKAVSDRYECGVYVCIFDDMEEYGCTEITEFSEEVYSAWELGYGADSVGVALVMSMKERDYDIVAYGNNAHYAFTDYGKETVADEFLDNFRENDWHGGIEDFISACGSLLDAAENGTPVDVFGSGDDAGYDYAVEPPTFFEKLPTYIPCGLAIGLIVALIYCSILKKQMKTAVPASNARAYIPADGVRMTEETDLFTHTTETRVHISHDDDHHSGGTTVNSSGFSHSSGKF